MNYISSYWNGGNEESENGETPQEETDPYANMKIESWGNWCQASIDRIQLRNRDYLESGLKHTATRALFDLVHVDMFSSDGNTRNVEHVCDHKESYVHKHSRNSNSTKPADDVMLVMNFMVPGEEKINLCLYFARSTAKPDPEENKEDGTGLDVKCFDKLLTEFLTASDEVRNTLFKFTPIVNTGGFIVENTVGHRPVILGNKLTTSYVYNAEHNYMEIAIDVGSSVVAQGILGVCKSYINVLDIELNFMLQGYDTTTLPEALIGGIRLANVKLEDVKKSAMSGTEVIETAENDGEEDGESEGGYWW